MTDIDQVAFQLDDALTAYIRVHNSLFKFSIKQVFGRIKYGRSFVDLALVRSSLGNIQKELMTLQASPPSDVTRAAFLSISNQYVDALIETTGALSAVCAGLAEAAERSVSYPKEKYRQDLASYEKSRERYNALGTAMNEAYRATYAD